MSQNDPYYNPFNAGKIDEALSKYKTDNTLDYEKFYNEINYVSPGVHMGHKYYDTCINLVNQNEKWLDVGCGCARHIKKAITDKNIQLHGMDVVDKSIAEAKQNGVVCIKNSAASKYPYDDETFHLITSTDVLEHLHPNDVSVAVSEIYRVCRKNGHALLAPAVKPDNTGKLHLTVKPVKWWTDHFEEAGFTVICFTGPDGILLRKK